MADTSKRCGCGLYAVGECVQCDAPLCGACLRRISGSVVCQNCAGSLTQEMASAKHAFDVDDEYRRSQGEIRRRAIDSRAFDDALAQSGLNGFHRAARRGSTTPNSPPLRGTTRWTVEIGALPHERLYRESEVDTFLAELRRAIPLSHFADSALTVDLADVSILVFAGDWEADAEAALKRKPSWLSGKAQERREAESQLRELIERRQATMRMARAVNYTRFYSTSWGEDREHLDWELYVTSDGSFSTTMVHSGMQEKIAADVKAWKFRLE